jgi:hypothetical protein
MPQAFESCVRNGGKVITKTIKGTSKYIHICYPKDGGSPESGEVKKKKGTK